MKTKMAAAVVTALLISVFAAIPVRADFADVVRAVESKAGSHREPIPLFGLVRMAIWIVHPDGVHDLQMAMWEKNHSFVDGSEVAPLIRTKGGANYQPIVTSHSRRDGEWTYVYARPARDGLMDIIVVTHDREDTVAIRAVVEPRVMAREFGTDAHHHGVAFARR